MTNDKQIGGSHYMTDIQPWDAIVAWELGFLDGCAVKYLARWRKKGGVDDLRKAAHFIEKLIEIETKAPEPKPRLSSAPYLTPNSLSDII
jgi:hypothetical protein